MIKDPRERRRAPRVPINLQVKIETVYGASSATGRDLSEGGIGVYFERLPPIGSRVQLTFNLPASSKTPPVTIKVTGEVKYHAKSNLGRWMGIRFLRLDALHQKCIHYYVEEKYSGPLPPPLPKKS